MRLESMSRVAMNRRALSGVRHGVESGNRHDDPK
jgi:hypothetical protein